MVDPQGLEKSAMLLVALGAEQAAAVLQQLAPEEVHLLGQAMRRLGSVPHATLMAILDEVEHHPSAHDALHVDSDAYVRNVLNKALGEGKAANMIARVTSGSDTAGIDGLRWLEAPVAAELLQNEHPQIIATALAHLAPENASAILNCFTDRLRNDTVLRIATLERIDPAALRELDNSLRQLVAGAATHRQATLGGVKTAAEILNYLGKNGESAIDAAREYDPDLAQRIMDAMFVFENLMDLDDRALQRILREAPADGLVLALKGAAAPLRERLLGNLSQRVAAQLREDLESLGPVRLSDVEAQQKEILRIVRQLADDGQIILGGAQAEPMI